MKYSVQQIEQALKDGKIIFFDNNWHKDLYQAKIQGDVVLVFWKINNDTTYSLPAFLNNFHDSDNTGWICTKIEGEEIMEKKTTPHKHAELIKKWAEGSIIQIKLASGEWFDTSGNPSWSVTCEYRVKPTLVKKWKWVLTNKSGEGTLFELTQSYFANQEDWVKAVGTSNPWKLHQKIDSTMIEVEE